MNYFKSNIKYLIEINNIKNKNQLSKATGLTRQALQKTLETDNPKAETLISISDYFKISIDDLLRIDLKNQK